MGGCTIPGLRAHYFECDICMWWYWGQDEPTGYPDCPIGKAIVENAEIR